MNHFVVTVAREYGSGGKTIGKMLAENLGVGYYDQELLRMASDKSGIDEALFVKADEQLENIRFFKTRKGVYTGEIVAPDSDSFVSNRNLFSFQAQVILELARRESCVIIGRCADYILREMPNVVRLYVHAPFDYCMARAGEVHPDKKADELKKFIQATDKRRADYYQYFTGRRWKDADNYDLCLNSSVMEWEKCVALVKSYLEIAAAKA